MPLNPGLTRLLTFLGQLEQPDWKSKCGIIWVALGALLLIPFPAYGWPLPERGVPIMWLMIGGALMACAWISRASVPFALLIAWAIARSAYHAYPMRSLQGIAFLAMAGLLYVVAREMPEKYVKWAAWAWLAGLSWELLLGLFNSFGVYPWMGWVMPEQVGKPMGMLTHPNYWGSMMAMGLPIFWALGGIPLACFAGLLILKTVSGGPVITAAVAALVMAWPLFNRWARAGVAIIGAGGIVTVMTLHEWRLSGRVEVWREGWADLMRWPWPFLGEGLGQWRTWADDFNAARQSKGLGFFATLQAHNEPFQLWFELGLIGVAICLLWLAQAGYATWRVWRTAPAGRLPGPWITWGRAPLERAWIAVLAAALVNMFGSPTFHLPAQAALALFALARIQADAEALHRRPPEPRLGRRTKVTARPLMAESSR